MDFNNSQPSEVKARREKFSVSIRRNEQDRFFTQYRKRIMIGIEDEDNGKINDEDKEPRVLDQSVINDFAQLRAQLVELMSIGKIEGASEILEKVRSMISSNSDPDLIPLPEFFVSGMPQVLAEMAKVPQVIACEPMINKLVWVMSNAFAAPSEYVQQLVDYGVLGILGEHIPMSDPVMIEHILWSLANLLADDCNHFENLVNYNLWNGLLERVNLFIKNQRVARVASWLFANAFRYANVSEHLVS